MKKQAAKPLYNIIVLLSMIFSAHNSFAQVQMELTPSLSVREEYDDNIYLDHSDETSDYLTMVSPGLNFSVLSQHTQLDLYYSPTFVWYAQENEDNTIRHSGNLTLTQELSKYFIFYLSDTYTYSEDPYDETDEKFRGDRTSRNTYKRNYGDVRLSYLFGPENSFDIGYRDERLRNEDDTLDDVTINRPYTDITYQLDVRNRVMFEYGYTEADYSRPNDPANDVRDDYYGHEPRINYYYKFTPHTEGTIGYALTTRQFESGEEDYKVHDGWVGFEHSLSSELLVSANVGFFKKTYYESSDDDGYTYGAAVTKLFRRGSIDINGAGGWDERALDSDNDVGFTRYWSAATAIEYEILEPLKGYAGGSYREDKDEDYVRAAGDVGTRKYDITRGNCGLKWDFLQWFSLSLDYEYTKRDDDERNSEYKDNRISMTLKASRLYPFSR